MLNRILKIPIIMKAIHNLIHKTNRYNRNARRKNNRFLAFISWKFSKLLYKLDRTPKPKVRIVDLNDYDLR